MNQAELNVLLIEDDDVDAMVVERALCQLGCSYSLQRAKDGIEALEWLYANKSERPFITLLDLNMPRMGGLELLERVRQDESLQDLPVFVLTTSNSPDEVAASYRLNVAGYFSKTSLGQGFQSLSDLLVKYWQLAELPR